MPTIIQNIGTVFEFAEFDVLKSAASYTRRKLQAETEWTPEGRRRQGLARAADLGAARRAPRPRWPRTWRKLGTVQYVQPDEYGATLTCDGGTLEIRLLAPNLARVRYLQADSDTPDPVPYAIRKPLSAWAPVPFVAIQNPDAYLIQTSDMTVGVHLTTGRVFYAQVDGVLLRADLDVGWAITGACRHRVALSEGEALFGLGERATPHDRRGRTHVMWNVDPAGYRDGDDPINMVIPALVGTVPNGEGTASYLALYENPYYGVFDLGEGSPDIAEHRFTGGELRTYVAVGPLPDLLERYTDLTGRHSMQPLWMLGYQQSRYSYDTEERVRRLARDFRENRVPCDVIHLDIDYMDGYRCFTWDEEDFPDPSGMAADLREQGFKLISIIDPGIKKDEGYAVYREGLDADHFVTLPDDQPFHAPVWPGDSGFPDFTAARTRLWWGKLYGPLLDTGIAGFWNDMNEPSAFCALVDRTLPLAVQHAMEGRGGTHAEAHNIYGMQMVRATREGLLSLRPDARPVAITRTGWAGVQRHATSWTGDNESTWDSLRLTVPMMLGLGLSGVGFTGPDVGGFMGEPDGELFTRWIQQAAFMPFFRAHTAKGFPDQEPWSYGEPYLSIIRRFIELRYELLPYLYTAMWQMCTRGWPMVRLLAWADPDDATGWRVDDAFLCGDKVLVAPVMAQGASERSVPLPSGTWYDFWTNEHHQGGAEVTKYGPLETMPLLVQAGAVLTLGEFGPSVEQRKEKFLRLNVYPLGEPGEATTQLYEDAGTGLAYQRGEQRVSHFILTQTDDALTITWNKTGRYTPPYEHIALTLCGLDRAPRSVKADGEAYAVLQTDPVRHTALLGVPIFDRLEVAL